MTLDFDLYFDGGAFPVVSTYFLRVGVIFSNYRCLILEFKYGFSKGQTHQNIKPKLWALLKWRVSFQNMIFPFWKMLYGDYCLFNQKRKALGHYIHHIGFSEKTPFRQQTAVETYRKFYVAFSKLCDTSCLIFGWNSSSSDIFSTK